MYKFDYCSKCKHLYTLNEIQCPICIVPRFIKMNERECFDKNMQSFFVCANLNDIQQSYYTGNIHCNN